MDVVCTHGAGLAVPTKTVLACRVPPAPRGQQADGLLEARAFGTLTREVLAWSEGLPEAGRTPVALERTGESWPPVANLREGTGTVCLVNAAQGKHVPGRQTDRAMRAGWPNGGGMACCRRT